MARFLEFSINLSTEGEGTESVAASSANGAGNVEGIRRLKAVRGGNRAIVTKIQREACSIISDGRDISTDNELSTRLISIEDTLKEKRSLMESLDQKILDICDIAEIEKEVEETTEITRGINVTLRKIEGAVKGILSRIMLRICSQHPDE